MTHLQHFARERNYISSPIELSNRASPLPSTPAGLFLLNRYRVPASIADLLACLAGLGIEEARQ